jgi:hypothetical protein
MTEFGGLTGTLLIPLVALGLAAPAVQGATLPVRIIVRPGVVAPYDWANIEVKGAAAATVAVRLVGATGVQGKALPWTELRRRDGGWRARLPQPVLAGIYPIELRSRPRLSVYEAAFLRVYWPGTETRPLFSTPEQVADDWVRHGGGRLEAIRQWPRAAIDQRLPALHRLYVVAYSLPGRPAPADRLGAWITAVREGFHGRWRLLEASVTPP